MNRLLLVLVVAAVSPLAGCILSNSSCTDEARTSVVVTVVDGAGQPVNDAKVTYTIDGGPEKVADCYPGPGASGCDSWSAGVEESGTFLITPSSAERSLVAARTVDVGEEGCHVATESVTLTLK